MKTFQTSQSVFQSLFFTLQNFLTLPSRQIIFCSTSKQHTQSFYTNQVKLAQTLKTTVQQHCSTSSGSYLSGSSTHDFIQTWRKLTLWTHASTVFRRHCSTHSVINIITDTMQEKKRLNKATFVVTKNVEKVFDRIQHACLCWKPQCSSAFFTHTTTWT